MAGSIDIVLDHHAAVLRGDARGPGARSADVLPLTGVLLREAAELRVPVRFVAPEPLGGASFDDEAVGLDALAPPAVAGPHVLVAADRVVRARAADAGFRPVAHPILALPVLRGETFAFARVTGDLDELRGVPGFVPYTIEPEPGTTRSRAFALLSHAAVARALDAGLEIECLALDPAVQDPLLVQLDPGARLGAALADYDVVWADGERVLLALDAQTRNDAIPAHGAHGHFRFLTPSPELLEPADVVLADGVLLQAPAPEPAPVTTESYSADIARYAGLAPLDGDGALRSRHSSHPDNARAVAALLADLEQLGYAPQTHDFAFGGQVLRNVIADHPGAEESLVVVGCHLDSTAARDPGYRPARDPARGADDDCSGMAALLAIARHLPTLPEPLRHTVRLCFFNAEESGLVGSRAYAAALKAARTPVAAVVCCDMIAFNSDGVRTFEVHAGYTNPAVRDISVPLATVVADAAARFGVLAPAQVYTGTVPTGGTDPARYDGAINRSDHASFHEQGYPAVLVSEDFFPNRPGDTPADPNPNYHSNSDAVIDADYAVDITRAVSVAVIALASG